MVAVERSLRRLCRPLRAELSLSSLSLPLLEDEEDKLDCELSLSLLLSLLLSLSLALLVSLLLLEEYLRSGYVILILLLNDLVPLIPFSFSSLLLCKYLICYPLSIVNKIGVSCGTDAGIKKNGIACPVVLLVNQAPVT